jgi:polyphosphate kinase
MLSITSKNYVNRDFSWLQFNQRVLAEANDPTNPIFERLRFLAITASNLDEFFMIRFASLNKEIHSAKANTRSEEAQKLGSLKTELLRRVNELQTAQAHSLIFLSNELKKSGIVLPTELNFKGRVLEASRLAFDQLVLPTLRQIESQKSTTLRQIKGLQLGLVLSNKRWVQVPELISGVTRFEYENRIYLFFLDHLLVQHLPSSPEGQSPLGVIRLTRDCDLPLEFGEGDSEAIPEAILAEVASRDRGRPQRLQYLGTPQKEWLTQTASILKLSESQIFGAPRTLCLHSLLSAVSELKQAIPGPSRFFYPEFRSVIPKPFREPREIFETLKFRDLLLHHPYDSFDCFVSWIEHACKDPLVESIDLTIYRVDPTSPLIATLKQAKNKRIRVIIELRARFDEMNNLRLAKELRESGVQVAFGFGKLKLHAKVALVTRQEGNELRRYTHLSTGNYNARTARQYTDLAILTANASVGTDAAQVFDSVIAGKIPEKLATLVSAPTKLHQKIAELIEEEIRASQQGLPARIFVKVNSLVDESTIRSLYRASIAGVKVDLVVRGACSLVPGIKGLSDNIRVISIVDRFLEHSRIFQFSSSRTIYLSSADWMPRNFFTRLELAFPVIDPRIYEFFENNLIPAYLKDTSKASELGPKKVWKRRKPKTGHGFRSQNHFMELAINEYVGTSIDYEKDARDSTPRTSIQESEPRG